MEPHQSLKICRPIPPGQDVWIFQVVVWLAAVAIDGAARAPAAATPTADFLRKSRLLVVAVMVSSFHWLPPPDLGGRYRPVCVQVWERSRTPGGMRRNELVLAGMERLIRYRSRHVLLPLVFNSCLARSYWRVQVTGPMPRRVLTKILFAAPYPAPPPVWRRSRQRRDPATRPLFRRKG